MSVDVCHSIFHKCVFCMLISGCVSTCILSFTGEYVSALDKVVYMNNRRFLPFTHPLRKASKKFPNAKAEKLPPPDTLTQEEVILNSLAYENAKNKTQASGFATATGSKGCPCLMLLPGHDRTKQAFPDSMHLIKNVTCEMVQLISGYKDNAKVRAAEKKLGRFHTSWIKETYNVHVSAEPSGEYYVIFVILYFLDLNLKN